MRCREANSLLVEYMENALDPGDKESVEQHLAGCQDCRMKLQEMEAVQRLLAGHSVPLRQESFWTNFLPQVRSRIGEREKPSGVLIPKTRLAFGFLSVLLVAIMSLFLYSVDSHNVTRLAVEPKTEISASISDYSSSAEQLAEALSSKGEQSLPVEMVLSADERQNLDLADSLVADEYSSQRDLSSMLSELSQEELKQLEERISYLHTSDIL
ncbi:MAG: zf-HC2 domain-containing protein [Candidatus Zixiibacteriota bacterium]